MNIRPQLEILEDRTMPANLLWSPLILNDNWQNAANWQNLDGGAGAIPTQNDDVFFEKNQFFNRNAHLTADVLVKSLTLWDNTQGHQKYDGTIFTDGYDLSVVDGANLLSGTIHNTGRVILTGTSQINGGFHLSGVGKLYLWYDGTTTVSGGSGDVELKNEIFVGSNFNGIAGIHTLKLGDGMSGNVVTGQSKFRIQDDGRLLMNQINISGTTGHIISDDNNPNNLINYGEITRAQPSQSDTSQFIPASTVLLKYNIDNFGKIQQVYGHLAAGRTEQTPYAIKNLATSSIITINGAGNITGVNDAKAIEQIAGKIELSAYNTFANNIEHTIYVSGLKIIGGTIEIGKTHPDWILATKNFVNLVTDYYEQQGGELFMHCLADGVNQSNVVTFDTIRATTIKLGGTSKWTLFTNYTYNGNNDFLANAMITFISCIDTNKPIDGGFDTWNWGQNWLYINGPGYLLKRLPMGGAG